MQLAHRALVLVGAATLLLSGAGGTRSATAAPARATMDTSVVRVQGGSTIADSGLFDGVFKDGLATGFHAAYPQYSLEFVSVGTGQAITNAENGAGDAVFTHSDVSEQAFVSAGYSYEPGGRLIMTSDFVTTGPAADPAGVGTGVAHDVVAAFREIASAGAAGRAEFIARGDGSGTSTKELSIWKLTGIPVDATGEPVKAAGDKALASWYHVTRQTQGANLQTADQCRGYASTACYTLTDRGTLTTLTANAVLTSLKVLAEQNTASSARGGAALLANPYHVYAVNPAREPGVNLPGALAFLNYLTAPATQAAIGNFPSRATPAFVPDAIPVLTAAALPPSFVAGSPLLLRGTLTPAYPLDPALAGATVDIVRAADPGTTLASTTVGPDGAWSAAFRPTRQGGYLVEVPQSLDHLIAAPDSSYRQPTQRSLGDLAAKGFTTLAVVGHQRVFRLTRRTATIAVTGSAAPQLGRGRATIAIQIRSGEGRWVTAGRSFVLHQNVGRYATKVALRSAGEWQLRSVYSDPGTVATAYSRVAYVLVR